MIIKLNSGKKAGFYYRLTATLLAFLFVVSPIAPVLAQDTANPINTEGTVSALSDTPAPATSNPVSPEEIISPEVLIPEVSIPADTLAPIIDNPVLPEEIPLPKIELPKTKFKKDNNLSPEEQIAKVREHLLNNNLSQNTLDRLDAFEAEQKANSERNISLQKVSDFTISSFDDIKTNQEAIEFGKKAPFKIETFEGEINTTIVDQDTIIQKVQNLVKSGTTLNSNISFNISSIASIDPNDYLASGGEVTFSQAIKDQANALGNDPLSMLNFVRNEVRYIPYFGSKKGSDATLVELAGNDMDKASLLIAMLRHSNIPARYRHVDAKMSIRTVTDLLGVDSAIAAARVLSLEKIPYILYTDQTGEPLFFVVEHTYVEAYMPYGYSRGVDVNDGGTPQWVPMDPTINAYYYEQLVDIMGEMKSHGFDAKVFFENYLNGDYGALEPLDAFKSEVATYLPAITPEYYPDLTYEDALTHLYPKKDNLEFIPGSLPYEISTDLNTYDYIPAPLRHTIVFTLKDTNNNPVLNHTAYVSDLADKELLVTYNAATPGDQATIDTFDTIYDVVPLSLVSVKPVIKINGAVVATGTANATLGKVQKYTMEFNIPIRTGLDGTLNASIAETLEQSTLTGTTNGIAFNTDRVIPPELRPTEDTASSSFMSDQMLYRTAVDYLDRLQYTHGELADIVGSDFTNTATAAVISNGIKVTNSNGQPYSFDWIGLRIDSSAYVRYFNRFNELTITYRPEFLALLALQASQDESDIFEDNFDVESVATVKGLKLVSSGYFPGTTLKKITSANESEIDSLQVSASTKTSFHTAIAEGRTIFTPSKPVTYGEWQGLFYITTNFDDEALYAIGEGLNGGYSACSLPGVGNALCNWSQNFVDYLKGNNLITNATIISPTNNQNYTVGDSINFEVQYKHIVNGATVYQWTEKKPIKTDNLGLGTRTLTTGYGTQVKVDIVLNPNPDLDLTPIDIPEQKESEFLEGFIDEIATEWGVEITSFLAGVGISEGIRLLTPMIAKKVGKTLTGKIVARFIPVVGQVLLVGSVGAIAFNGGPLAFKCVNFFSDSMDDNLLESRSHWYFCGKLTAQSLFIAAGAGFDRGLIETTGRLSTYLARKIGISSIIRSSLRIEVKTSLEVLESSGWARHWQYSNDGEIWRNDLKNGIRLLPNNVSYTEWDVYEATSDATRGLERFVRGSDGSIYYTNNHYGDVSNGEPPFYRIQ